MAIIERIPCFEKDEVFNYKVTSLNVLENFKASGRFEGATKFGFMLQHDGLASNTTPDCLPFEITCKCRETEEIVVFTVIFSVDNKPRLSLLKTESPMKDNSTYNFNAQSDSLENTIKHSIDTPINVQYWQSESDGEISLTGGSNRSDGKRCLLSE